MQRRPLVPAQSLRSGLTLIDVLVILGCLLLLLALVTPATRNARGAARRMECMNNMMNLGLGVRNFATANNGRLPLLEDSIGSRNYGWPAHLLPYLDASAVYRTLEDGDPGGAATRISLPVFTCPDDPNHFRQPGGLSYAANAGYGRFVADTHTGAVAEIGTHAPAIDFDRDGTVTPEEIEQAQATGVFWRISQGTRRLTFDDIEAGDGQSATILLAENANAGTWSSTKTMDLAFVIGLDALTFEPAHSARGPLQLKSVALGPFAPSADPRELIGRSPAPSSHHVGISIALCDGSARMISPDIDPLFYAEMMTPNGIRQGQTPRVQSQFEEEFAQAMPPISYRPRASKLESAVLLLAGLIGLIVVAIAIKRLRDTLRSPSPSETPAGH